MIELSSLMLITSAAVAAGMLTGLLPGIGPSSMLLILYSWLMGLGVVELFVFYSVLMASAQYYGSITAIIYGVSGEITSTPAVQYGHPEFRAGRGAELLASTATASLIASLMGLFVFYLAHLSTDFLSVFINNSPRLLMLTIILVSVMFTVKRYWLGACAIAAGLVIGHVGFDSLSGEYFLSSSSVLPSGVPLIPLFLGFLILPDIINYTQHRIDTKNLINMNHLTVRSRVRHLCNFQELGSILRGSVIGAVTGLIPSIGTSVSSLVAANLEGKITQHASRRVVSAEAANNAAAITVLIPLVILALPIVPSEAIIMGLAERQGFGITIAFEMLTVIALPLMLVLLAVNLVNWVLAGIFYQAIARLYSVIAQIVYYVVAILCIILIAYTGYLNNQPELYLIVGLLGTIFGVIVRDFSIRLAFVFAFFLATPLYNELYRFVLFHF